MIRWAEESLSVAGVQLSMVKGGSGRPLVIFHDELGYPGWMTWNESLAHDHTLYIPLQPGFGKTPKLDWVRTYRDLAGFYSQVVLRDQASIRDPKMTVADVLDAATKALGAPITVTRFARLKVGETAQ